MLLTPQFSKAIESMKDVINSGLKWSLVLYGEEVETYLRNSVNPVEKAFWKGKTVIDFSVFPYEAVSSHSFCIFCESMLT